MDFQNRAGVNHGKAGSSASQANIDRRERLRKLALETIDLTKDPYFMKNHLGSYECRLCLTLHSNEGSYLAHTQGKKHQSNLGRRAAREQKDQPPQVDLGVQAANKVKIANQRMVIKIGRPGYKVTKIRDPITRQLGLLYQIQYPEIGQVKPQHRFMSAFEQHIEAPNKNYQYLLFAAEPYETIGFKIQSREIDRGEGKFFTHWDPDSKQFHLQLFFKNNTF
ncbi:Splicing factor 3A subunit 2 [Clydaea vesicula]|uniref:Splicing factor 3A subunit 2 n=1 Tax=Clydaea vesicula TaxID=447962 RepID=A0AAD5U8L2_9FUNG|nr:Splicing factor 3A subunit 2 [Clydaea vesicula]KAJ3391744.1 Splicing factor 3A subunit 2 [Lobulomyces angularis]